MNYFEIGMEHWKLAPTGAAIYRIFLSSEFLCFFLISFYLDKLFEWILQRASNIEIKQDLIFQPITEIITLSLATLQLHHDDSKLLFLFSFWTLHNWSFLKCWSW